MSKEISEENSSQTQYLLTENNKRSLLKRTIHQMSNPSFLCQITPENPNFLEVIECNDKFLKHFGMEFDEVVGNNYDFLLQNENIEYGSDTYFQHINLITTVKSLQVSDIKVGIPNPKHNNAIELFKVNFAPSRYKSKNIYCIFSFESWAPGYEDQDTGTNLAKLVQNLERVIRNEKLLRRVSDLIASESNLEQASKMVAKIMCEHLKVDRCILYDCNKGGSGFLVEYCIQGVKQLSQIGDADDPESPMSRYIEIQNQLFLDVNRLKKTTTMMICEDVKGDANFKMIDDIYGKFGIGSQIVVTMISNDEIIGGLYLHQSQKRSWFFEESELINIISNQFSTAIDRSNYTHKLLISNKELLEQSNKLSQYLIQEKKMRELQSEFVALVSHEFKTPLQIIDAARELVLRKIKAINIVDEVIKKSLDRIKTAIFRMNNLIQSNLNLSKIEIGDDGIKINEQGFDIKALTFDIIEKNSHFANEKQIKVEVNINNLPNSYFGDQKLIDHSFTNIITNAIKYSKSGSEVKIIGDIIENNLFLKVTDNGIGIPTDDLEKVGKKFFRAKNTLSVAGTGIGLYLTKYFIELHKGSVLIESKLNSGTAITVTLPLHN